MTPAQSRALGALAQRYCADPCASPLDLAALFGRHAPRHLEIGCGTGDMILEAARRHPENDYLGLEVYRPGLGSLMRRLDDEGIANVRLVCADAGEVLGHLVPDGGLEAIYVYFPDPWPKKRHHKRRLLKADFAALLARKLARHGRLFIATDWDDYFTDILAAVEDGAGLRNLAGPHRAAPRPAWRPLTRYERRALRLGHVVRDLLYCVRLNGPFSATQSTGPRPRAAGDRGGAPGTLGS